MAQLVKLFHPQLQQLLRHYYEVMLPLYIHGTFGIGKTEAVRRFVRAMADKMGLVFSDKWEDINNVSKFLFLEIPIHQFETAELKGIPVICNHEDGTKYVKYIRPEMLPTIGQGAIFFDEINLAFPSVQSNTYGLIDKKRLMDYEAPKGFMLIGAGNLIDDKGHTYEMAMPLKNRFMHVELETPSVTDRIQYEEGHDGDPKYIKSVMKGWVNDFAIPAGVDVRVINYLLANAGDIYKYEPKSREEIITCATPRMWERVSTAIKGVTDLDFIETLVSSGIGLGLGAKFVAFCKLANSYNVQEIFKLGKLTKPKESDQRFALISALVGYYGEQRKGEKTVTKNVTDLALILLKLSACFDPEHQAMLLNQVKSVDETFFKRLRDAYPTEYASVTDPLFNLIT